MGFHNEMQPRYAMRCCCIRQMADFQWVEWSSLEVLKVQALLDIYFNEKGSGIAIGVVMPGQYGVVLRTIDSGRTWVIEKSSSDSGPYWRRVAVNKSPNWALSHHEILLGERGKDWKAVLKRPELLLGFAIDAPSLDSVVAILYSGGVIRSEDRGQTWQVIALPTPYDQLALGAVKFSDPLHGWVAGHHGIILATHNGGLTWEFESQVKSYFLHDIAVSDSKVFVVGNDGAIYWRSRP